MKKYLVMICLAVFAVTMASAQTKKPLIVQDSKQHKVDPKQRGANVKTDVPTTDVVAPAPTARGASDYCTMTFDNYTGYWVKIYVDGNFKGYVEPYGVGSVTVYGGYTTYYCETTGGTYYWSGEGNCEGEYHYNLR
jgi:hypothetical protein